MVNFDDSVSPTLLFAVADCNVAPVTENNGSVTVLPHMMSVTRTGGAASVVSAKINVSEKVSEEMGRSYM